MITGCTSFQQEIEPDFYKCEDIIFLDSSGTKRSSIVVNETDLYSVYAYPNTDVPVALVSSDSTVIIPVKGADKHTFSLQCLSPGSADIIASYGDVEAQLNCSLRRSMSYDFIYDKLLDRLSFVVEDLQDNSSSWAAMPMHVTLVWECEVAIGYSESYINRFYPISKVIEGTVNSNLPLSLGELTSDYASVKKVFDTECAKLQSVYPGKKVSDYSKIILNAYVRPFNSFLTLSHVKTPNSVSNYSSSFTFETTLIE